MPGQWEEAPSRDTKGGWEEAPPEKSAAMKGLEAIQPSAPVEPYKEESWLKAIPKAVGSTVANLTVGQIEELNARFGGIIEAAKTGSIQAGEKKIGEFRQKYSHDFTPESDTAKGIYQKISDVLEPFTAIMPDLQATHALTTYYGKPKLSKGEQDASLKTQLDKEMAAMKEEVTPKVKPHLKAKVEAVRKASTPVEMAKESTPWEEAPKAEKAPPAKEAPKEGSTVKDSSGDPAEVVSVEGDTVTLRSPEGFDYEEKLSDVDYSKAKPEEWKTTYAAVEGAKTVPEALEKASPLMDEGERELAAKLAQSPLVQGSTFGVKGLVETPEGKMTGGAYTHQTHHVDLHAGGNVKNLLHEAVHAATSRLLDAAEHPAVRPIVDLYNQVKTAGLPMHGLKNVREFVAEAFTNPEFQDFLRTHKTGNWWEKLKNAVMNAFGVEGKARTALDDVLEHGSKLIETGKPEQARYGKGKDFSLLSKKSPKEKFVEEAVKKFGEGYRTAAERLWDKKQIPLTPKASERLSQRVQEIADLQFALQQQRTADKIRAQQSLNTMSPDELSIGNSERVYDMQPEEVGGVELTPEEKNVKEHIIDPLNKEAQDLFKEAQKVTEGKLGEITDHNPRVVKTSWLDKVQRALGGQMGTTGFAKRAATQKARSMYVVEDAEGNRTVVNQDGHDLNLWFDKKGAGTLATDRVVKPGESFESGGRKYTLKQATTREIEAATGIEYSKAALANLTSTILELKATIRETRALKQMMEELKKEGHAVLKQNVDYIPNGFRAVNGHPVLEKYWFRDRFAEAFEDGIVKSGSYSNMLERINTAATGTMFWNPIGHQFNALDHFVTTIGWDFFKPWRYPSLVKTGWEAYKDVAQLRPDYLKLVDNGAGMQYARVVAEDFYDNLIKTSNKEGWQDLVKEFGKNPVAGIYTMSKHALWAVSDMFMMHAYKYMADKKGMEILDKALQNYVEAHNPNYRISSRIGFDGLMKIPGMSEAVAGAISRSLSIGMQSRAFNLFGRYHYGQFKSLASDLKAIAKQSATSPQSRADAFSHLTFVMFNVGVVYPVLWDGLAKMMSGDQTATQRRAGASTIPYTIWHILLGDESVSKLIGEAYQLPPITKALVEIPTNRNLFTGQHIWEPGDEPAGKAMDIGTYIAKTAVQPLAVASDIAADKPVALTTMGIKTGDKESKQIRSQIYNRKAAIRRRRKREEWQKRALEAVE